eukprot:TRINITY_DN4880_c1_g2_i5.p1 TRINITY_DN4880_c1_g2~~TRINITY_DN4880_c1_g2_i5.p1  ORF type:complete len:459 (-),score=58.54 TRINITY_DN4880_c1_g2_i5:318-1619(-)
MRTSQPVRQFAQSIWFSQPKRHIMTSKQRICRFCCVAQEGTTANKQQLAKSAKEAVECGLKIFNEDKNYQLALNYFQQGLELNPNEDESRAALYNSACAYTKLKNWKKATECVQKAVNDYGLKINVAQEDEDLAPLRETREWLEAQEDMIGGLSKSRRVNLREEAKAPFRFTRVFILGGLVAGAAIAQLITASALIASLTGAQEGGDLSNTLQNFSINLAGLVVLGFFLNRDLQAKDRQKKIITREEDLGALQVELTKGRPVPLLRLRGAARPVIIAGSKRYVDKCIKSAEEYKTELEERGVSLLPVYFTQEDEYDLKLKALKEEFAKGKIEEKKKGFGTIEKKEESKKEIEQIEKDKRWKLSPHNEMEWKAWIQNQTEQAGVEGTDCYIQVQLDGSVRSSGTGTPPWQRFLGDLPPLKSIRTTFTDGVGTNY